MKLDTKNLLFDEFDVKEHSTTETLKQGKKEFQKNTIKMFLLEQIVYLEPTQKDEQRKK